MLNRPIHLLLIHFFGIVIRTCRYSAIHIQHELVTHHILFFSPLLSLSDLGAGSHAGGAGDLLRAAAAKAAEEDLLPEEREAEGPPRHFGT